MSLINQMLQDLDARGGDGARSDAIHAGVRAVPERRQNKVVWWFAIGGALLLGSAITWLGLRASIPPAPAPRIMPAPELALKLAPDLRTLQGAVAIQPTITGKPTPVPSIEASPTAAEQVSEQTSARPVAAEAKDSPSTKIQKKRAASQALESTDMQSPVMSSSVGTVPKVEPAPASVSPQRREHGEHVEQRDASQLADPNKQVKELTKQQRAENEYRKAVMLISAGKAADAINDLEQALQFDALHAAARQALVGVLLAENRKDEALRKLQEGLSLDPSQAGMAMILARLQLEKSDVHVATETLQRTLPYAVDKADFQAFLAALLQRESRHKEAIEHYLAALQKMPQNGVWWMGLGISLQADGRLRDAREAFGRAKTSNGLSTELQAFVEQRLGQLPN